MADCGIADMAKKKHGIALAEPVELLILVIRGQRVMLDADLARVYAIPPGALNRAVKRNRERFPDDFMFQLTTEEDWPWAAPEIPATRLHRTRRGDAVERPAQPPCCAGERGDASREWRRLMRWCASCPLV